MGQRLGVKAWVSNVGSRLAFMPVEVLSDGGLSNQPSAVALLISKELHRHGGARCGSTGSWRLMSRPSSRRSAGLQEQVVAFGLGHRASHTFTGEEAYAQAQVGAASSKGGA